MKGKIGDKLIEDTQAVVVYSDKNEALKNATLLEAYSRGLMILNMKYVPFGLRRNDEPIFGRLLQESIVKGGETRNMAIYGVSPAMMDYGRTSIDGKFPKQTALWDQLYSITGVHRVDPHIRTVDLGKWHLSVASDKYEAIGTEVDQILGKIHEETPASVHTPYKDFPTPTRMQTIKGTTYRQQGKPSDSSVKYCSWLTADITVASTITDTIATPIKHKRVSITAISYSDAVNTVASPITPVTPNHNSMTSLSTLTETTVHQMIQSAINTAITKLTEKHNEDMNLLNKKFEMFQATAVQGVIEALTGKNTPLATKADLNRNIEHLHTTIDSIKQLIIANKQASYSTPRRTSKRNLSNLNDGQESMMLDI